MARKYRLDFEVNWLAIGKLMDWKLGFLVRDAQYHISSAAACLNHHFPDEHLRWHEFSAARACEKVFSFFEVYSSLRSFLRWSALDESRRGVSYLRSWYSDRSEEAFSYGDLTPPSSSPFDVSSLPSLYH